MSHTKGKLIVIDSICSSHESEDHPCLDLMLEVDEGNGNSLTRLIGEIDILDEEIAHRLVLVWNLCVDISTEDLKSVKGWNVLDQAVCASLENEKLRTLLDHERAVKGELIEALEEAIDIEHGYCPDGTQLSIKWKHIIKHAEKKGE